VYILSHFICTSNPSQSRSIPHQSDDVDDLNVFSVPLVFLFRVARACRWCIESEESEDAVVQVSTNGGKPQKVLAPMIDRLPTSLGLRFLDGLQTDTGPASPAQQWRLKTIGSTKQGKRTHQNSSPHLIPRTRVTVYDAARLVPFYAESSQVPGDLRRCTVCPHNPPTQAGGHANM
jgi:hypothetical protein